MRKLGCSIVAAVLLVSLNAQAAAADDSQDKLLQAVQAAQAAAVAARDAAQASQKAAEALAAAQKTVAPVEAPPAAPPPPPVKPSVWSYQLGLNLISDTGNATAFSGKLSTRVEAHWTDWALLLLGDAAYGQAQPVGAKTFSTTALNADFLARGDRKFSKLFSVYLQSGVMTDHVASIEYQAFGEAGASITWYEKKETDFTRARIKTDVGFRITHENDYVYFAAPPATTGNFNARNIYAPRLALSFLYALSKTSLVTEDVEALEDVVTPQNLRVTSITAISTEVAKGFSLSLSFKVRYIGVPATPTTKSTDTELAAGITWAF